MKFLVNNKKGVSPLIEAMAIVAIVAVIISMAIGFFTKSTTKVQGAGSEQISGITNRFGTAMALDHADTTSVIITNYGDTAIEGGNGTLWVGDRSGSTLCFATDENYPAIGAKNGAKHSYIGCSPSSGNTIEVTLSNGAVASTIVA